MESKKALNIKRCVEVISNAEHYKQIKPYLTEAISYINELESENETIKFNMQETEKASFNTNQMNGNLVIENEKLKKRVAELKEKNQRLKDCIVTLLEEIIGEEELTLCARRGVESTNFEELCAMGALAWQGILYPSLSHQNEKIRKAIEEVLND